MQKKGVPEIQEVSSTLFSYELFGLGFTGVGLPSLARRARVPVDSATLSNSAKTPYKSAENIHVSITKSTLFLTVALLEVIILV